MNTQSISWRVSTVIALIAITATATVWPVPGVRAVTPTEPERTLGMIGLTRGQTMRLNIVNLAVAVDGQVPPDPCRMVLTFRNADGRPFTNSDGQPLRRAVELQAGQSAFLDLNADMYGPSSINDAITRLQVRPFVRVQSEPSGDQFPPDPCRVTMEVFDNASGRTSIFAEHAGIDLDRPPPTPCCQPGGMIGLTRGQTMRLNIVNLAVAVDGQLPPDPCRVLLTFRNADGRPFTNSDGQPLRRAVELQAGQSAFLDLNADNYFPATNDTVAPVRMQLRPFAGVQSGPSGGQIPPDPCRATTEVYDNANGRTSIFAASWAIALANPE